MNQVVVAEKPSRLDEYRVQVLPPERARDLYQSLPNHIKPAVFERNLVNALMANPSLMEFDPRLIFREVSKAAGLGLLLDPLLGEGYIVTAYNYKTRKVEPQLRVGGLAAPMVLVLGPVVDEEQEPRRRQAFDEAVQQRLGLGVDPVEVLEHEQHRLHLALAHDDALHGVRARG